MTLHFSATGEEVARATISPCGRYRYTLERRWAKVPRFVLWLMLNPSTADASSNDPTIRRCIGFARTWGYTGILVGNLYAWRATNPRELWTVATRGGDPIGPENGRHLDSLIARAPLIVCAWGKRGPFTEAWFEVMQRLRPPAVPHFLRLTKDGQPSHPLYLPGDLRPTPWDYFTQPRGNGAGG